MAKFFTEEELEELRRADAELDEEYSLTQEDIEFSRTLDREAMLDRLDNCGRRKAARSAAYYEANKDKIADYQAAYREANKDKIAARSAAYYEANKDKIAAQRRRRREEKKKAASGAGTSESSKGKLSTSILTL